MRKNLVLAFSVSLFFVVTLPLQTYLANADAYDFGVWRLVAEQSLFALAAFAALAAILWAGAKWLGGFPSALFAGAMVCAYLETGPFSFGLPEINGELPPELDALGRKVWDALALAAVLAAFAVPFRRVRAFAHWVALAVAALGLCSLLDVRRPTGDATDGGSGFELNSDIVDAIEYSPTRNVLMIVCDSVPADIAADVFAHDPSLAAKFPGFVNYGNNISPLESTKRGVPLLLTGRMMEPDDDLSRYMASVLGPDSILNGYLDGGWAVYSMLDVFSYGKCNRQVVRHPPEREGQDGKKKRFHFLIDRAAEEIPYASLMSVVSFRLAPFALKSKAMYKIVHSKRANGLKLFVHEHALFPNLASRPVSSDPAPAFVKVHSYGAHMPLVYGLDGERVKARSRGYESLYQASSNVIAHLSRLMDAYRGNGVYDRAFIVVAGDHGSSLNRAKEGANPKASTWLMVKRSGAEGPFETSALATTSLGVAEILRRAREGNPTREEMEKLLYGERRLFRFLGVKGRKYVDYVYRPDGTVESVTER